MSGATSFRSSDLVSDYHQMKVVPEDCGKTAVVTPCGLFQCSAMPFGFMNSPGTFQRMARDRTQVLRTEDTLAYLDDFICFHIIWEEQLVGAERIPKLCEEPGLKLAGNKCQFARGCITLLGCMVSESVLEPQPQKLNVIKDWKIPTNWRRRYSGL